MAVLAALRYGFPANQMIVIGVTGTKGKTTTCNMIHRIFTEAGKKEGRPPTVNFKLGGMEEGNHTKPNTPKHYFLQRKIREMANARCEVLVLEVTSHALLQSRLWGINVDTAVLTNIAQDHLDYHGSMEEYRDAKALLFHQLNSSARKPGTPKLSVVNQDDPEHETFNRIPADQVFEYGIVKGTYTGRNLVPHATGTDFIFRIPNGEVPVNLKIPGRMNVFNALAAATVATAHQINLQTVKKGLEAVDCIPGRLEIIDEGQPFTVVVDFAHTEDSLKQVLELLRELTKGRLILVFGATGDRDTSKRPKMGAVADKYCDAVILTNDDPYTEDPRSIARMVREGIARKEGDRFWQVLDRKEAIRLALALAKEGDTVLLAGKGAEEFQVVGKRRIPHDDRKIVREFLGKALDIDL